MVKTNCSYNQIKGNNDILRFQLWIIFRLNPVLVNIPILYPMKTQEMQRFYGIFRGIKWGCQKWVNSFLVNVPIIYPLKTPENLWFNGVFRRYKMGTLARYGLRVNRIDLFFHTNQEHPKIMKWFQKLYYSSNIKGVRLTNNKSNHQFKFSNVLF